MEDTTKRTPDDVPAEPRALKRYPLDHKTEVEVRDDGVFFVERKVTKDGKAYDDAAVDARLAEFRESNGGKPPNIIYLLIDDLGFGDMGIPELNAVRG